MGPALFTIDGAAAPGVGEDTRHTYIARPVQRRTEGFAGDPNRYVIKGARRPGAWRITGALLAASFEELLALVDDYDAMQADLVTHAIGVHGVDYQPADLAQFQTVGNAHSLPGRGHD